MNLRRTLFCAEFCVHFFQIASIFALDVAGFVKSGLNLCHVWVVSRSVGVHSSLLLPSTRPTWSAGKPASLVCLVSLRSMELSFVHSTGRSSLSRSLGTVQGLGALPLAPFLSSFDVPSSPSRIIRRFAPLDTPGPIRHVLEARNGASGQSPALAKGQGPASPAGLFAEQCFQRVESRFTHELLKLIWS